MVLKSWMYPRYQWLWKAKQPATQTTRHAICAMPKHPKVTDAFLFPLQSMFFDSLRMDRLSTAVWIDEDRCCTVVHFFFSLRFGRCHRRYGPAPSIITCNAALGAVGRGKRWVGSSAFWRQGGFKSLVKLGFSISSFQKQCHKSCHAV